MYHSSTLVLVLLLPLPLARGSAESPQNQGFEQKESGEFPLNEILSHLSIRFRENSVECRRVEILR